jgi:hypothetical protein
MASKAPIESMPASKRRPRAKPVSAETSPTAIVRVGHADRSTQHPGGGGGSSTGSSALDFGSAWTYAPSPEATDHVKIDPRYELFIGGQWVRPQSGRYFDTISPSTEEKLAEIAEADERDVDRAVTAARHAYEKYWSKLRPIDRGKYIYRIARALQEKSREFAIVESMDGGKPIKESRDVDVPLAAPLLLLRGLGRQAQVRVPGAQRQAARRRRPGHPVELPAADGGVEARARARLRQHLRAQARRDHAAHGALAREDHRGG